MDSESLRLLVVGGAGHVGSILAPALESRHEVRYFDLLPVPGAEDRTIVGSVTDAPAVERAVADRDAIVYLAMGNHHDTPDGPDSTQSQFDVNVQGVYRVLHQALQAGARRFVYASSMSVYGKLGQPIRFEESLTPDSWHVYGLTKRLGECVCEIAAMNHPEATIVGLRLVHPLTEVQYQEYLTKRNCQYSRARPLGPKDAQRLFLAALNLDRPGVHMLQGAGDLAGERFSSDAAFELLSWRPQGA